MFLHFRNVIPKLTPPQGFGDAPPWHHGSVFGQTTPPRVAVPFTLGSGDGAPTQAMQIPMSLWDYMLCKMMWKCICAAARAFWSLGQNDEQVLDVLILDIYGCFSCRMCI